MLRRRVFQRAGRLLFPLGHTGSHCLCNHHLFQDLTRLCAFISAPRTVLITLSGSPLAPRLLWGLPWGPRRAASTARTLSTQPRSHAYPAGRLPLTPPHTAGAVTPWVSQSPAWGVPGTGHTGQSGCLHPDLTRRGAAPLPPRWTGLWAWDPLLRLHPVGSLSLQGLAVVLVFGV